MQQGTISRHLARNAALTIIVNNFTVIYFMCLKVIIIPTRIQGSNFYVITSNIYLWLICLIWMLHLTVYIYWNVDLKAGFLLVPSMLHYPMSIKGSSAAASVPVVNLTIYKQTALYRPLRLDFEILYHGSPSFGYERLRLNNMYRFHIGNLVLLL